MSNEEKSNYVLVVSVCPEMHGCVKVAFSGSKFVKEFLGIKSMIQGQFKNLHGIFIYSEFTLNPERWIYQNFIMTTDQDLETQSIPFVL